MPDPAIRISNLSKVYRILHQDGYRTNKLGEAVMQRLRHPLRRAEVEEFWALRDIDLEIERGEVVGIIGRNGAGKSTLLKVLSRITEPTTGRIELFGRVGSLLEVGTGFHPELTGRENIFLNGSILGMRRREIRQQFDAIVDFAGVEKFLDTPVKRYSSGMYVRLAFAVAAHLNPEILIVDEVLAVGDAEFQKKCLGKMQDVAHSGRTVLFVSHNMGAIQQLCSRGVVLSQGRVVASAPVEDACQAYLNEMQSAPASWDSPDIVRSGSGDMQIAGVQLRQGGLHTTELSGGVDTTIEVAYRNLKGCTGARILLTCYDQRDVALFHVNNTLTGVRFEASPETGRVELNLPGLPLNVGRYRVAIALQDEAGAMYDHVANALSFTVIGCSLYFNGKYPDPQYSPMLVNHDYKFFDGAMN